MSSENDTKTGAQEALTTQPTSQQYDYDGHPMRTPDEWCKRLGIEVLDPDGWRGQDAQDWSEPLTELDFMERVNVSTHRYVEPAKPETLILVGRNTRILDTDWREHPGKTLDQVLATMTERARDGKANAGGFDIIEVTVQRRFEVRPVITSAEVTEVQA